MAWYLAPSLQVLRAEVDTRWPRRDRTSDGTIGDAAHASGKSDHNPNSRESVNAIDLDKDGVTVSAIIAAAERHPSVHYWIYNRQIADRDSGFARQRYTGSNPHDKHLHISIRQTRAAEQDRRPWGLLVGEDDDVMTPAEFAKLLDDPAVQARLRRLPWQYQDQGQPSAHGIVFGEMRTNLRALLGQDWVNEREIIDGVLAGLGEQDLGDAATALRAAFGDRVGELAALLATPESQARG